MIGNNMQGLIRKALKAMDNVGPHGEACDEVNNASRALVDAVQEECGECWLGRINLYREHRVDGKALPENAMWKRNGEFIYNFGADFVLPKYDEKLHQMILDR